MNIRNISTETLSIHWLDWGISVDPDQPLSDNQFSQALADAANYYAVRFGIYPTRARIHKSQQSGQLALMAEPLGIEIVTTLTDYNINHIMLSCDNPILLEATGEKKRKEDINVPI